MILCFLKRILHKKKSIFMQLLKSAIPPLTTAALQMIICKRPVLPDHHLQEAGPSGWPSARGRSLWIIICKRPAPDFDNHEEGTKNAFFWDPSQWDKMCFECQRIQFQWVKESKFSHLLTVSAEAADAPPPYGQPDCIISAFLRPT